MQALGSAARANIILGEPGRIAMLLNRANRLQWVQSTFAGVDHLCQPGQRRDYLLTGVKEVFGPAMSEYVFGYILAWERHFFTMRQQQLDRHWSPMPARGLHDQVLGICGTGSIGRHVAETGSHFRMRVIGYRRNPEAALGVERIYTGDELGVFLSQVDYLVLALPDTPGTRHLIDRAALIQMKETAVVINVGRGSAVVESDLAQALQQGYIRGAVLDVFEQEPLPTASPLWGIDNCLVTPHHAAVSFPAEIVRLFQANYRRFVAGEELRYVVDFERGY